MPGTFSPPPRGSDPDMHHGTCVTHVPWCMPGSLTNGFLWSRRRGKLSRHSRRMRNPQFYESGKNPMKDNPSPPVIQPNKHSVTLPDLSLLVSSEGWISEHTIFSQIPTMNSPNHASVGCFVSDLCTASVTNVLWAILCNTGSRYYGTR